MAITLALTADSKKTALLNYCSVEKLLKDKDEIIGVEFQDTLNSKKYKVKGKVVINATGVFAEEIIRMDQPDIDKICLLYTSPSPRDLSTSRMPSSA